VRWTVVLAAAVAASAPALADDGVLLASRWPGVPDGHGLSLEDQITDHLTQPLGNELGKHLDLLSHDMFQLNVDCRGAARACSSAPATTSSSRSGSRDIQFDTSTRA